MANTTALPTGRLNQERCVKASGEAVGGVTFVITFYKLDRPANGLDAFAQEIVGKDVR